MAATNFTARTADSTDRTAALTTSMGARTSQPKTATGGLGATARRLLNALMRSLATPHV